MFMSDHCSVILNVQSMKDSTHISDLTYYLVYELVVDWTVENMTADMTP